MTMETLKEILQKCKNDKQIFKALDKANVNYTDDSSNYGYLNLHLENGYRIYKNTRKEYILQKPMQKVKLEYSGIPTFFATNSCF